MNWEHWRTSPAPYSLGADAVHLWRAPLDAMPEFESVLSAEEWDRAHRFHFVEDTQRFIASRVILRTILAGYTGIAASALRFATAPHGKPRLEHDTSELRFNLSHSHNLMLLALSRARELGVDLERMRADVPFEALAEQFFQPDDALELKQVPAEQRAEKFYAVWTCTEARLKADGVGLMDGLRVQDPERWRLAQLTPAPGYAAALAVEGGDFSLELRAWSRQRTQPAEAHASA